MQPGILIFRRLAQCRKGLLARNTAPDEFADQAPVADRPALTFEIQLRVKVVVEIFFGARPFENYGNRLIGKAAPLQTLAQLFRRKPARRE